MTNQIIILAALLNTVFAISKELDRLFQSIYFISVIEGDEHAFI